MSAKRRITTAVDDPIVLEHDFENEIGDALPPPETFDDDAFRRSYDLDYGEVEDGCGAPRDDCAG